MRCWWPWCPDRARADEAEARARALADRYETAIAEEREIVRERLEAQVEAQGVAVLHDKLRIAEERAAKLERDLGRMVAQQEIAS